MRKKGIKIKEEIKKRYLLFAIFILVIFLSSFVLAIAIDRDRDGVPDDKDKCLNSKPGEEVDKDGCDAFQFCKQFYCAFDCYYADFKNNENVTYPRDCVVVIVNREGKHYPECVPTDCNRESDLELEKEASNKSFKEGENVTFKIKVINKGPLDAQGILVKDLLDKGLTYLSHSGGNYDNNTGIWNVGNLSVNKNVSLEILTRINMNNSANITNTAEIIAAKPSDKDSTPGNNNPNEDDQASVTIEIKFYQWTGKLPKEKVNVSMTNWAPNSYFWTTLKDVPNGYDVSNGQYPAWCSEQGVYFYPGVWYEAMLYSSYDPNLQSKCSDCYDPDWDKVNYIINHRHWNATREDVQKAIWYFIDHGIYPNDTEAKAMVDDALANGSGFRPIIGQYFSIIVDINDTTQLTFFEIDP